MKKVLLAATISSLFAVAAHAQSSVTLYGVIDAGVVYANNSHTPGTASSGQSWGVGSGNVSDTLWGLKGSEDSRTRSSAVRRMWVCNRTSTVR